MSVSAISGISGSLGFNGYRISSINGNPYSTQPISRIDADEDSQRGRALVIGQKSKNEELYVKDYGELGNTSSMATGDFAEMLSMREKALDGEAKESDAVAASQYTSYLNDTIGMMGFQNGLREQLNGVGFEPFS